MKRELFPGQALRSAPDGLYRALAVTARQQRDAPLKILIANGTLFWVSHFSCVFMEQVSPSAELSRTYIRVEESPSG